MVKWTEVAGSRHEQRGKILTMKGALSGSRDIEMSRLTFFEDRLMEVVFYYKRTSFSNLETLRGEITQRYLVDPTSPDGTTEMAYKTYWFNIDDKMSITIRRITKNPNTELYVQYQHKELIARMKEKTGR